MLQYQNTQNHTKINYITSDSPAIYHNDGSIAAMPLSPRLFVNFSLNKIQMQPHRQEYNLRL